MAGILASIGGLVGFWALAALVAIDDIDFFNRQDFLDLHGLHHEHIFAALVLFGVLAAAIPALWSARRRG
jgi:hypothetical protein